MQPSTSLNVLFDANYRMDVVSQMEKVVNAGFTRLDMNFWDWSHDAGSPFVQDNWRDWVERIRTVAENMNARFTQAHAHVYSFYAHDMESRHAEQVRRSIIGAGMLGIPWVVLHPSQRPDWESEHSLSRMIRENTAYFRRLAHLAAEWHTGLALENMSSLSKGLPSAELLCELVDAIDLPNVGACWDTGHAHLSGQDQPGAIRALGSRLHALHIADNLGQQDDHTMPYLGNIDWPPIAEALHSIAYDGDFTFEAHTLIRRVPESCKESALRLLYQTGLSLSGNPA